MYLHPSCFDRETVYCNSGILEKGGLSWEVGGVWEKFEAPRNLPRNEGIPCGGGVEVEGRVGDTC